MDQQQNSQRQASNNKNSQDGLKINKDNNINEILKVLGMSFDQNRFTQKYQDENIEKEFLRYSYQEIRYFGRVYAVQQFTILFIYMMFQTYKLVKLQGVYPNYKWALITSLLLIMFVLGYLLAMKKFKALAKYFADIFSLVVFVGFIELAILGNPTQAAVDGFTVITANMTYLAINSYSQGSLFYTYLLCIAYLWGRTYHWINDDFRYIRFNVFFNQAFAFIYFFSRAFHSRERKRFQQSQEQQRLLSLFHNLIRVYHDGILITQEEKIVFHNNQIQQIFNTNDDNISVQQSQDSDEENRQETKNQLLAEKEEDKLIHELQKTEAYEQIEYNPAIMNVNLQGNFNSMWEYIIHHKAEAHEYTKELIQENPLDGVYFKYQIRNRVSNNQDSESEDKKLQVFTQVLQIGSQNLILTTIRDMSTWLQVEKQKNLSEMKTIAFASAAHEFRNPLNAIVTSLSLLENSLKSNTDERSNQLNQRRITDYLSTAKSSSKLMLHLVNDILDFSQLESKSLILYLEFVTPSELVNECTSVLEFKAQTKGIDLKVDLKDIANLQFCTDKNRLIQILINLTSNAIKYTNNGYVKIQARLKRLKQSIVLKVIDTGVGIPDEKIPHIFTPFTKILTNRNLNNEGVGLGLTISKNIAEALGGTLQVQSKVNVGSTFTLTLPLDDQKILIQKKKQENMIRFRGDRENFNDTLNSYNFKIPDDLDGALMTRAETYREITKRASNFIIPFTNTSNNEAIGMELRNFNQDRSDFEDDEEYKDMNEINPRLRSSATSSFMVESLPSPQSFASQLSDAQSQIINSKSLQTCTCSKILIIDDEPFNLIVMQGLFEQLNSVMVDKTFNGQDAIKMIINNRKLKCHNHQPYQMILLDKNMPIMNGIQTATEIRKIENDKSESLKKRYFNSQYVLILVTGDENAIKNYNQISYDGKNLFDEVLLKPIDLNNLQLLLMRYEIIH